MKIKKLISRESYERINVLDITMDHEISSKNVLLIRGNDGFPTYDELKELEPRYFRLKNAVFLDPMTSGEEEEDSDIVAITLEMRIKDTDIDEMVKQFESLKEQVTEQISPSDLVDILSYIKGDSWGVFHIRFFNIANPKSIGTSYKANYHLCRHMMNDGEFKDNVNVQAFQMLMRILEKDISVVEELNILKSPGELEEVQLVINAEGIKEVYDFISNNDFS